MEAASEKFLSEAVVAGHVCLDIIPQWDGAKRELHKAIVPGAMLNIGPADLALGGAVANTGMALHRLGTKTRLMGKTGDDPFGHLVRELLNEIDPALHQGMVVERGENTSYTIVISPPNTDRVFLHHPGANDQFGAGDVVSEQLAGARLLHFGYPPLMRRIYSDGGRELAQIFQLARSMGLTTSLDMTQIDRRSDAASVDWPALLATVLPHVDVFLPSIDEIRFMLGNESTAGAGVCGDDLGSIASELLELGSAIVVLKLGDEGLYLRTTSDRKRLTTMGACAPSNWRDWIGRHMIAPCFEVKVVGTTGAGDCTIAGFLGGLLRDLTPEETITAAVATGACCVEAADATSGVLDWDTLQRRIRAGWPRRPSGLSLPGWRWNADRTVGFGRQTKATPPRPPRLSRDSHGDLPPRRHKMFGRPHRRAEILLVAMGLIWPAPTRSFAATPAQIDAAMQKAVDALYAKEANGNWEEQQKRGAMDDVGSVNGWQWTGMTAISTYALLCTGEKEGDSRIVSAINFLVTHPSLGVYASAARCLVWSRIRLTPTVRLAAQKDVDYLLESVRSNGDAKGLFYYEPEQLPNHGTFDNSTSQMGALGLSVMEPRGFEVPQKFWALTEEGWHRHQLASGGWVYGDVWPQEAASMTAAGVATLFLAQAELHNRGECSGNLKDPYIIKGLDWLANNFDAALDVNRETGKQHFEQYALFTISRVGVASGLRTFGNVDWYQRGADYLIGSQAADGTWSSSRPGGTPLGLLFLTYGSSPVVVDKLQYTLPAAGGKAAEADWNQRPQDVLNFVDWMSQQLEHRLNWQVVDLNASRDVLHDAPIMVIAGSHALNFGDADLAKLRRFVEEGGMILGNADCDNAVFSKSFVKLGNQLFPSYEFAELPVTHPIFTREQYQKFKRPIRVLGLRNGVRELMLLPSADLCRACQHRNDTLAPDMYHLFDDIVLYAMDTSGLERKGESYLVEENPAAPIERTIKLARLQYAGGWDPEPGGWPRLTAILHNTRKIALQVENVKLGDGKLTTPTASYPIAHLTGAYAFKLSDAEREDLKKYVLGGGTLIIDAAGGSTEFTTSAEQMLTDAFGTDARQIDKPLERASSIYQLPDHIADQIQYRNFARIHIGREKGPLLRGIKIGGRLAIIYSREDLSAGLVGEPVDGVNGYTPASATALMTGIILTTSKQ